MKKPYQYQILLINIIRMVKVNSNIAEKCYHLLIEIPKGKVTSYKIIANKLNVNSYRYIGKILGQNKNAPYIPCHRVVMSNGYIGGYIFGVNNKIKLLKEEGIEIFNGRIKNFKQNLYQF